MTPLERIDRMRELAVAEPCSEVREEIVQLTMDMCLPLNRLEEAIGKLARDGHIRVGVLPPPKSRTDDDFSSRPQIIFGAMAFGDVADRALTGYKIDMPPEALELYVEHIAEFSGSPSEESRASLSDALAKYTYTAPVGFDPREICFTNGGAR